MFDMAKKKKKFSKGKMARHLVYYCIGVLTIVLIWAMITKSFASGYSDLSDVLTFAGGVFGGELLLLLLKRIFAKPNNNNDDDCSGGENIDIF